MSDTRPAPDTPEELIWLRGYEAGVIECRADQAKASEAIQDARRSSIQSLIQKGIERDEEMRALQARCDKLEAERGSYREVAFDAIHDLYRIMLLFRSNPQDVYGFAKDCRKDLMKQFGKIDDARSVVDGGE